MCHLFLKRKIRYVENHGPVSILPTVSKIFERIMQNRFLNTLENFSIHFYVDLGKDSVHNMPYYR